jgi:hypothetical protein
VAAVTEGAGVLTAVAAGTAEDTAEVAEDATVDAALPALCATRTGPEGTPRADPGGGGSCVAAAGRAKITIRIRPNTKVAARPPQA